jgi:hypothetical protein
MIDEQIRLSIDESEAVAAADRANRAIEKVEEKAVDLNEAMQKSVGTAARSVVSITERSQQSIIRLVESAERLAARSSQGAVAGLETQRNQIIRKLGGQQELIERVNSAYGKLIVVEQNREARLQQEQGAKRQLEEEALAARQAKIAQEELARTEKLRTEELKREAEVLERSVRLLERRAQLAGKSGSAKVQVEQQQFFADNAKLDSSQVERATAAFSKLNATQAEGTIQNKIFSGTLANFAPQLLLVQLATTVFNQLVSVIKEGTVESAKYAARTEQLSFAQRAVARANNISAFALEKEVEQTQRLGISQQDARESISKMVASQLEFTKASDLARVAQNTGRIANISSSDAFDRLTQAIVTAQPEMLRMLGISVNFESVYAKLARQLNKNQDQLTENEKAHARLNVVLEKGAAFNGVYEESAKTAGGQVLSLKRLFDELRQEIGDRLLPAYTLAVAGVVKFIEGAKASVPVISDVITVGIAPYTLAWKGLSETIKAIPNRVVNVDLKLPGDFVLKKLESLASTIRGLTGDSGADVAEMNQLAAGALQESSRRTLAAPLERLDRDGGSELITRFMEKESKSLEGVNAKITSIRSSRDNIIRELSQGLGKLTTEDAKAQITKFEQQGRELRVLEARKAFVEEAARKAEEQRKLALRKAEEQRKLALKANQELFDLEEARVFRGGLAGSSFEVKADDKELQKRADLELKFETDRLKRRTEERDRVLQLELDAIQIRLSAESESLASKRDLDLAQLDSARPRTLADRVALEQKKLEITQRYLVQESILRAEELNRVTDLEVSVTEGKLNRDLASLKASLAAGLIEQQAYTQRRVEVEESAAAYIAAVRNKASTAEELAQAKAALVFKKNQSESVTRQSRLIEDEYQKTFEKLERGFNGLFDSMENGAKGFASRLKNILLSGFLTPIKQIASSYFANLFTPLVSQLQRQQPAFSGRASAFNGALGFLTPQNAFQSVSRVVGGPGGTGGFAGPVSSPGVIAPAGGVGLGSFGQFLGLAGYKSLLTQLGQIGATSKLFAKGVYGAKGGALLAGGGILAADGLRRGGLLGTLERTAGGALIGAKFGGPVGAAIGAGIGLGAGLLRGLIKSAEQKVIDKVDALYGYRIDKPFAKTLVDLARGSYSSNFDLMLASQQAKDLIELWALSNGKSSSQFAASKQQNLNFSSSGGVLRQLPTYYNGSALPSLLPTAGAFAPTMVNLSLSLDGKTTEQIIRGGQIQAIVDNPRAVQQATVDAQNQNFGRAGALASLLAPQVVPG